MPKGTLSALKQVICIPFAYSVIFLGSPQTGADTVNVLSPGPDLTDSKGVKIVLCVDGEGVASEPGERQAGAPPAGCVSWSGFPRAEAAGGCEAQTQGCVEVGGVGGAQRRKRHVQSQPESSLSRAVEAVFVSESTLPVFESLGAYIRISASPVLQCGYVAVRYEQGSHLLHAR